MSDLTPGNSPERVTLQGQYCRLEPLQPAHTPALYAATSGEGAEERYRYVFSHAPADEAELATWVADAAISEEFLYSAVIDQKTGLCGGRQSLMRIRPEHRSIEIGAVMWGRGVARTRIATEAVYLTARYVFEDLGYRRFEWKCNNLNAPSKRAAIRFGFSFEGISRQDSIVKGKNRDTAWFSMLDSEWPELKSIYETWLAPKNFDANGAAKTSLATTRD